MTFSNNGHQQVRLLNQPVEIQQEAPDNEEVESLYQYLESAAKALTKEEGSFSHADLCDRILIDGYRPSVAMNRIGGGKTKEFRRHASHWLFVQRRKDRIAEVGGKENSKSMSYVWMDGKSLMPTELAEALREIESLKAIVSSQGLQIETQQAKIDRLDKTLSKLLENLGGLN